jgi:hypothetical protein
MAVPKMFDVVMLTPFPLFPDRMPLSMEPNFEDLSCQMIFGKKPPPIEQDEAMRQPCFATCPTANLQAPACPKLQ